MDKSLLIAVFVPTTDETGTDFGGQRGELATGYPVGKDLILTARHVLHPEPPCHRDRRHRVKLRWHYFPSGEGMNWIEIPDEDLVWESPGELDAALIRCPRPRDAVGWGIVSRDQPRDGVTWASEGFPRATRYENRRNPSSFIGKVCSKAPSEPCFELTVETAPEDEEGWKGVSGMPVFVGRRILGVVGSVPPKIQREKAVRDSDLEVAGGRRFSSLDWLRRAGGALQEGQGQAGQFARMLDGGGRLARRATRYRRRPAGTR
jgi:hypothetical protein